jgi:hypothetical protein
MAVLRALGCQARVIGLTHDSRPPAVCAPLCRPPSPRYHPSPPCSPLPTCQRNLDDFLFPDARLLLPQLAASTGPRFRQVPPLPGPSRSPHAPPAPSAAPFPLLAPAAASAVPHHPSTHTCPCRTAVLSHAPTLTQLNAAMGQLLDEFSLVAFSPLDIADEDRRAAGMERAVANKARVGSMILPPLRDILHRSCRPPCRLRADAFPAPAASPTSWARSTWRCSTARMRSRASGTRTLGKAAGATMATAMAMAAETEAATGRRGGCGPAVGAGAAAALQGRRDRGRAGARAAPAMRVDLVRAHLLELLCA